jgi:hypothetical protein
VGAAGTMARQVEADDVGFSENSHHPEPTTQPNIYFDDVPVEAEQTAGDREVLKTAFSLLLSPAPASIAAARVALLYSLFNPGSRPVDLVRLFHGVKRSDLTEARLELAALLTGPDERETA